jgi:hypothetical protein
MGLGMFWADVAVRNPLSGDRDSAPDVPHITADALDAALSKKNEWQFVGPLRGFDETDFDFLSEDRRDRLSRLVHEFNGIAPKLRSLVNRKLTEDGRREEEEVANRARPLLRDIILLLEQDRYFSGDGLRYGKLVENELGDLPDGVVDLRFFVGKDASGDPGFYAWAFIAPERSVPDEKLFTLTRRVRPLIEDAMYRVAGGHFAYLSFRGVGETIPQGEDEEVAA